MALTAEQKTAILQSAALRKNFLVSKQSIDVFMTVIGSLLSPENLGGVLGEIAISLASGDEATAEAIFLPANTELNGLRSQTDVARAIAAQLVQFADDFDAAHTAMGVAPDVTVEPPPLPIQPPQ